MAINARRDRVDDPEYDQVDTTDVRAGLNAETDPEELRKKRKSVQQIETDPNRIAPEELERPLSHALQHRFLVVGDEPGARRFFYQNRETDKLAFEERGAKIVSQSNSQDVAEAMVKVAEAKNWPSIKVSGSAEFKRQIWLQANLHGIEAQGYKPKERDIAELEQLKQQRIAGSIEKSHERKGEKEKPKTETEIDKSTLTGTLVAHGHAPFEHDPKGTSSYFVDIETTNGRKTVWGVDLHRAIDESKAKPGDKISIEHKGKEPVKVMQPEYDAQGKKIGEKEIQTHRNAWDVRKSDRAVVALAVAEQIARRMTSNPETQKRLMNAVTERTRKLEQAGGTPAIFMYDKQAPARAVETHAHEVEHIRDRNQEIGR